MRKDITPPQPTNLLLLQAPARFKTSVPLAESNQPFPIVLTIARGYRLPELKINFDLFKNAV